ncbi:MAG: hypothetical protein ACK4MV_09090 [Beijerinckiaceae bacterium]
MPDEKLYFVLVECHLATPQYLQAAVPFVQNELEKIATKGPLLSHRSADGSSFAFLLRTAKAAAQIRDRLTFQPELQSRSSLHDKDKVLVLEVGDDYDVKKFNQRIEPILAGR